MVIKLSNNYHWIYLTYKIFQFSSILEKKISVFANFFTWLDQMFWQIYQKLMLSGFLSSGNLCLIHHLNFFWPHAASAASDRKGAKIQHEFSWFCQKFFFQKLRRKWYQSSNYWIQEPGRLSSDFSGLRNLSSLIDVSGLATSLASTASKAQFTQKTSWSWWSDHHCLQKNHYW